MRWERPIVWTAVTLLLAWTTWQVVAKPYLAWRRREQAETAIRALRKALGDYSCVHFRTPEQVHVVTATTDRAEEMKSDEIVLPPGKFPFKVPPNGGYGNPVTGQTTNQATRATSPKGTEHGR